jgi:hypothetical protein
LSKDHRLIAAKHFAGGNAEQQAVTDLAGGAGDRNANGFVHSGLFTEMGAGKEWAGRRTLSRTATGLDGGSEEREPGANTGTRPPQFTAPRQSLSIHSYI